MLESYFFYLFSGLAITAALIVVGARNAVHSVMSLILCLFNTAALFFMLDAEFLGIILILIYVGAVMVLFMFVVMMLEVNFAQLREGFLRYLPIGGLLAVVLLSEMIAVASSGVFSSAVAEHAGREVNNTVEIGRVLYTKYLLGFGIAAIILLVALIGAIVMTLRERKDNRRQRISEQVAARKEDRLKKAQL